MRQLLAAGADATCQNSSGHTALTRACAAGKVEVVQLLLAHPSPSAAAASHLNLRDNHGNTALLWCARTGNAQLCKLLLDAGANVNQPDSSGRTPIFHACVAGSSAVAQHLVAAGADLSARDTSGKTALDYVQQNAEMRALLQSAAMGSRRTSFTGGATGSVSASGFLSSPGMAAAAAAGSLTPPGSAPTSVAMNAAPGSFNVSGLASGGPVSAGGVAGGTIAMLSSPALRASLVAGSNSNNNSARPSQAFHSLTTALQSGSDATVISMLAAPGAEALLQQRDMLRNSALHFAASRGSLPVISRLLELGRGLYGPPVAGGGTLGNGSESGAGAGNGNWVDDSNMDGHTGLYLACRGGHRAVVQVLLAAGASPNTPSREASTPLHAAAAGGHGDIVRLLLDRGAALNAADSHNNTPLLRAAELGHANVCSILLRQVGRMGRVAWWQGSDCVT